MTRKNHDFSFQFHIRNTVLFFTFTFGINDKIYSIYNRMFRDPFFNDFLSRETEKENQKIISMEIVLRKYKNVKKYNIKKEIFYEIEKLGSNGIGKYTKKHLIKTQESFVYIKIYEKNPFLLLLTCNVINPRNFI